MVKHLTFRGTKRHFQIFRGDFFIHEPGGFPRRTLVLPLGRGRDGRGREAVNVSAPYKGKPIIVCLLKSERGW
jgi:hypothetical protein